MVFSAAAQLVHDALSNLGGVAVVYSREDSTVNVTAVRGATRTNKIADSDLSLMTKEEDFLIKSADLVLDSVVIEPERGDIITVGTDVYEVNPIGNESAARRSDADGYVWRIHTKKIELND